MSYCTTYFWYTLGMVYGVGFTTSAWMGTPSKCGRACHNSGASIARLAGAVRNFELQVVSSKMQNWCLNMLHPHAVPQPLLQTGLFQFPWGSHLHRRNATWAQHNIMSTQWLKCQDWSRDVHVKLRRNWLLNDSMCPKKTKNRIIWKQGLG